MAEASLLPIPDNVRDLARRLIGTIGMGELLDEINELSHREAKQLDLLALLCESCGWWFAKIDIVDTGTKYFCKECHKEHKDGDE